MSEISVKKRKFLESGFVEITLSSKEKFILDPVLYNLRDFEVGCDISPELYEILESEKLLNKCRKKASDLLFRRMHSKGELKKKLYSNNLFPSLFIDKVLAEMDDYGYLDDRRFAQEFCKELKSKGYGPGVIRQKMYHRGLGKCLIQEIIQDFTESKHDFSEELLRLAQKKLKSLHRETDLFKKRHKLYRYLAGKGWGGSEIASVIEIVLKEK